MKRWVLAAAGLILLGCSTARVTEATLRHQAARDVSCDETKLTVTRIGQTKSYTVSGCGKDHVYVCDEWDSYNQKPICHQKDD